MEAETRVQVELANMEWKVFLETRGAQDFQLARGAWCDDYNKASTFLDLLQSNSGYNDGKFTAPQHEYTRKLLDAMPRLDKDRATATWWRNMTRSSLFSRRSARQVQPGESSEARSWDVARITQRKAFRVCNSGDYN